VLFAVRKELNSDNLFENYGSIYGLTTLRKMSKMTWPQIYADQGLKWEMILSKQGPSGARLYSFREGKGFRGIGCSEGEYLRILSLHPDHDSAYKRGN